MQTYIKLEIYQTNTWVSSALHSTQFLTKKQKDNQLIIFKHARFDQFSLKTLGERKLKGGSVKFDSETQSVLEEVKEKEEDRKSTRLNSSH